MCIYIYICTYIYIYIYNWPDARPPARPPARAQTQKELFTPLDLCVSSLRRGHANLLCIVPILTDDPRRESSADAKGNDGFQTGSDIIYIYIYI